MGLINNTWNELITELINNGIMVNRNNYSLFDYAIFECRANSFRVIFRRNNYKVRIACK